MPDPLDTYRAKRDFARTPEPQGRPGVGSGGAFVVQLHAARRLHFDLRLEHGGVLLSWAVPKGPSFMVGERRLAVRTEDHPLDYAGFEGTIPEGEYGAGSMLIWDRGRFQWRTSPDRGLAEGSLKMIFHGTRMRGGFALVRLKPRAGEKQDSWLLLKERDEHATGVELAEIEPTSIVTGRSLEDIAAGATPKRRARRASPPDFAAPQLATLADAPPAGAHWVHEVKYDGYRLLAACDRGMVRLFTRTGLDWTQRMAGLANAFAALDLDRALIDGEVCVVDANGRTSFAALQDALKSGQDTLSFFAFDLLRHGGKDLRPHPLRVRKRRLEAVLAGRQSPVRYSTHVEGDGARVLDAFCAEGFEGVVSKRADAPYVSGRTKTWLKVKCAAEQEFVVGGYARSDKPGRPFAALLLGAWDGDKLVYAGKVGSGFDQATLAELKSRLDAVAQRDPPFAETPREARRKAVWAKPILVVQARMSELTPEGRIRHGVFLGLREDKPAREVSMEEPWSADEIPVRLTHPDKLLFPGAEHTKADLARYFMAVAPAMGAHAFNRPVSIVRCPEGRGRACFFQKHATAGMPKEIGTTPVEESDGEMKDYLMLRSAAGLAALAQIGAIELHLWGARADKLERPDRLVFDLDPSEELPFSAVREAAFALRDLLSHADIVTFPLLTGGKGVHLVAPLSRRNDWARVSRFAAGVGAKCEALAPDRFVATMSKAKRVGRIFIDHLRNKRGATAICPYSPRARAGAPAALPVTWEELGGLRSADAFGLEEAARRVAGSDPWRGYAETTQSLTREAFRALGLPAP